MSHKIQDKGDHVEVTLEKDSVRFREDNIAVTKYSMKKDSIELVTYDGANPNIVEKTDRAYGEPSINPPVMYQGMFQVKVSKKFVRELKSKLRASDIRTI